MSEFKRKQQASGFKAGEGPYDAGQPASERPDFGALSTESGSPAVQSEEHISRSGLDVESAPARPAAEPTTRKRYYNPGEAMKKKGCIGCGGMALAAIALTILALAVTLL